MHFPVIVLMAMASVAGSGWLLEQAGTLISRIPQPAHPGVACGVGFVIGLLLACSARCGAARKVRSAFFLRPALALFAFAAVIAALAGLAGFFFVSHVRAEEQLWQPLSPEVASRQNPIFFAVLCAQLGGAAALILGGVVLAHFTVKLRRQAQTELSRH